MKNFGLVMLIMSAYSSRAGVAGNVQRADTVEFAGYVPEDMDALFEQVVDHSADR